MQPQLPSGVESTPEILTSEELCAAGGKKTVPDDVLQS